MIIIVTMMKGRGKKNIAIFMRTALTIKYLCNVWQKKNRKK